MAEEAASKDIFWVEPEQRGIIPLHRFHVSRSLAKTVRKNSFHVTINEDFGGVLDGCAEVAPKRKATWINQTIRELYTELHAMGHCHSIEVWDEDDKLVGGLYGVHLGAVFFGESMFSRKTNASKIALVHLVARMLKGKFELLDTQFTTEHLKTLGAVDICRKDYHALLENALALYGDFYSLPQTFTGQDALAIIAENT